MAKLLIVEARFYAHLNDLLGTGMNLVGPSCWSSKEPPTCSKRTPPCSVKRPNVDRSSTYAPWALTELKVNAGTAVIVS